MAEFFRDLMVVGTSRENAERRARQIADENPWLTISPHFNSGLPGYAKRALRFSANQNFIRLHTSRSDLLVYPEWAVIKATSQREAHNLTANLREDPFLRVLTPPLPTMLKAGRLYKGFSTPGDMTEATGIPRPIIEALESGRIDPAGDIYVNVLGIDNAELRLARRKTLHNTNDSIVGTLNEGDVIRFFREAVPWDRNQLAEISGTSHGAIEDAERGRTTGRAPTSEKLFAVLALEYGISKDALRLCAERGMIPDELFRKDNDSALTRGGILQTCRVAGMLYIHELAAEAGISPSTLVNLEQDRNPDPTTLAKVVNVLGSKLGLTERDFRNYLRKGRLPDFTAQPETQS